MWIKLPGVVEQGQIFLDCFNPILENAIKPRLLEGKREPCELKVSDFDDAMYTLEVYDFDGSFGYRLIRVVVVA